MRLFTGKSITTVMMYRNRFIPCICTVFLLLGGCAWFGDKDDNKAKNWTVERLYSEAKGALDSGYYSKAVEYYEFLETRFPFGVYGQQSLLDLAYAYYKTEEFDSSIAACDRFIRLYPQNTHVDYVYFLKGLVNFNRGKGLTEPIFTDRFKPARPGCGPDIIPGFFRTAGKIPPEPIRRGCKKEDGVPAQPPRQS